MQTPKDDSEIYVKLVEYMVALFKEKGIPNEETVVMAFSEAISDESFIDIN